jgi:pimeloyl-ACP methyl ester carboxylesterase
MTHIPFARSLASLLSLAILAAAGYLLWTWWQGEWLREADGDLIRLREDWRLWAGLVALAWSFVGRRPLLMLLARRDEQPTRPERAQGEVIESRTGSRLYVEETGPRHGPPIILTHGWGMDSTFWFYARRDLGDRFRLLLWDLPGLGRSRARLDAVSLSAFADDLATLIERVAPQKPVLVGHSIGGMIIQTLLRDRPELEGRIAGVVLLNTTFTNPLRTIVMSGLLRALQPLLEMGARATIALQPLVWAMQWQSYASGSSHLAHRLGFGRFVTRSQLEHTTLLSTRNPPGVQAKGTLAMFRWDAEGALRRSNAPALVIGGDRDIVTKLEANRMIAGDAPRGRLQVVEDVNHMGPMERADLYNRMIGDFAASVQQTQASDLVHGSIPRPPEPEPLPPSADEHSSAPRH